MSPSLVSSKLNAPENIFFRRLAVAPDYLAGSPKKDILATWSACSVPLLSVSTEGKDGLPSMHLNHSVPWVKLPYPAIDVKWCPFKDGDTYASFLTACSSCPLQLWDADDASLRASYCCYNAVGKSASPYSLLWTQSRTFVVAGYGGPDDHVHVRFYNLLREGNTVQSSYSSPFSKGMVSALSDGPAPYQENMILAGFIRSGNVDVVDTRYCGTSAVLRGLKSGVAQIQVHPTAEYLVYAGARLGENRILCWDLRKCTQVLTTYERKLCTQQPAFFGFLPGEMHLVSATHDGGVLVFDGDAASGGTRRLHSSLGPTAGLAVVGDDGAVAVTVGEKELRPRWTCEVNTAGRAKRHRAVMDDSEPDDETDGEGRAGGIAVFRA